MVLHDKHMVNMLRDIVIVDVTTADYTTRDERECFIIDPEIDISMKVKTALGTVGIFTFRPGNSYGLKAIYTDAANDLKTGIQIGY